MTHGARVSFGLAWRSLILVRRMPAVFIPSLVMPLFILVATAGAFRGIAELPSLEGVDYTAFTIPLATVMGAGFAGANAGLTMARDIEGGFVDRLVASPAPRVTLIAGPLIAAAARSVITTTVVLAAGLIAGVGLPGVLGTLVVYLMALGFGGAAACWTMGVALRARTVQAAPLMQVVVFLSIFTSVAYAPREVLGGSLRTLADWNPVTRVLETSRAAELGPVTWDTVLPGLLSAAGLVVLLGTFTAFGLAALGDR
jgi:ABC-2 type transport system permease protein